MHSTGGRRTAPSGLPRPGRAQLAGILQHSAQKDLLLGAAARVGGGPANGQLAEQSPSSVVGEGRRPPRHRGHGLRAVLIRAPQQRTVLADEHQLARRRGRCESQRAATDSQREPGAAGRPLQDPALRAGEPSGPAEGVGDDVEGGVDFLRHAADAHDADALPIVQGPGGHDEVLDGIASADRVDDPQLRAGGPRRSERRCVLRPPHGRLEDEEVRSPVGAPDQIGRISRTDRGPGGRPRRLGGRSDPDAGLGQPGGGAGGQPAEHHDADARVPGGVDLLAHSSPSSTMLIRSIGPSTT